MTALSLLCALSCSPSLAPQELQLPRVAVEPSAAHATDDTKLVVYDMSDLVIAFEADPPVADEDAQAQRERAQRQADRLDHLVDTIQRYMQPGFSREAGHQIETAGSGNLVGLLNDEQHRWLQRFLELQRAEAFELYVLDVTVVEVDPGEGRRLGLEDASRVMPIDEQVELLGSLRNSSSANLISAPSIALYARQPGQIMTQNQVAYIQDYELHEHVEPGGQRVVDPVIDVVTEGFTIDARVFRVHPETLIVELEYEQTELERPMGSIQTQFGEVGLPVITRRRLSTTLYLGQDEAALFTGLGDERGDLALLVSARAVEVDPSEGQPADEEPQRRRR